MLILETGLTHTDINCLLILSPWRMARLASTVCWNRADTVSAKLFGGSEEAITLISM
ncbi:rCG50867 [Rattus norvegicus]|uniref:RCG50867 n=1 Tax=Rattus norvegicus TaxID=10116 RepID=A6KJ64_RAT|nr:rCG50867 [Rattus norvegicus]